MGKALFGKIRDIGRFMYSYHDNLLPPLFFNLCFRCLVRSQLNRVSFDHDNLMFHKLLICFEICNTLPD